MSHSEMVRPANPPAKATWPLTPIDRFASRWLIQGTWIFGSPIDIHALKHGLIRLLEAYPILCGRVVAGERIDWAHSGIPVIEETDTAIGVQDFGPATVDVRRFGARYSSTLVRHGLAPLLTVKLTHLRDGCVLAICGSHVCLDGNGFYSMARNLSLATTGRSFAQPIFERPATPPMTRRRRDVARSARAAGWQRMTILDAMRMSVAGWRAPERSFVAHFAPATLRRCQAAIVRDSGSTRVSTNSALVAHVAHCVVRLLGLDIHSKIALSAAVDQRGRVADVPEDFAGNAVSAVATAPISASASAADIAARLHERLEPLLRRPSLELEVIASLTSEIAGHRLPYSPLPGSPLLRRGTTLFYTNSFSKLPIYDLDFGGRAHPIRPVRAIPHNLGDPILLWPAPPSVGGVELYFSGTLARAVAGLGTDHCWWTALHDFV